MRCRHREFAEPQSLSPLRGSSRRRPLAGGRGPSAMRAWGCQARPGAAEARPDESVLQLRDPEGGASMRGMQTTSVTALFFVLAIGCGGQTATSGDADSGGSSGGSSGSSGSGSGSSSGSSGGSSGSSSGASSLPAPGTPACDDQLNDAGLPACTFCSDDLWHCSGGGTLFAECPSGVEAGAPCKQWNAPDGSVAGNCIVNCPGNTTGLGYMCATGINRWSSPNPPSCP